MRKVGSADRTGVRVVEGRTWASKRAEEAARDRLATPRRGSNPPEVLRFLLSPSPFATLGEQCGEKEEESKPSQGPNYSSGDGA